MKYSNKLEAIKRIKEIRESNNLYIVQKANGNPVDGLILMAQDIAMVISQNLKLFETHEVVNSAILITTMLQLQWNPEQKDLIQEISIKGKEVLSDADKLIGQIK